MRCEKLQSFRTNNGGGVRQCERDAAVTIKSSSVGVGPHPARIVIGHFCTECADEIRMHVGWQRIEAA